MHWSYHSLVLSHWNIVCAVMCCYVHVCTVSVRIVIGIFSCIAGLLTYFVSAHQGSELISQRWLNIKRITLNKIIRCFLLNNSLKIICNFSPSFSFHLSRILFPLARRVITYWLDNNRFTLWKYTGTTVIECTLALVVDEVYQVWEFSGFFLISWFFRAPKILKSIQIMQSFHILNKNVVKIAPWS